MSRRCFSDKIVESDAFYSLPPNAQALYLHLSMSADDDGFINRGASISGNSKSGKTALKKLVESRFILQFDNVFVIKHWRMSNSMKNDRLKPLSYATIAQRIWVKPNMAYTDHPVPGCVTLYEMRTGIHLESAGNPNLTQPNLTQPNLTQHKEREGWFGKICEQYPEGNVGNVQAARESFYQVIQTPENAKTAEENLELWKRSEQWTKDGGKYIPYLCNWLLRGAWRTKPAKMDKGVSYGCTGLGEAELEAIQRILNDPTL